MENIESVKKKRAKNVIPQILEEFNEKIDNENSAYTLKELTKLLSDSYKLYKTKRKSEGEKKAPTEYNIFVKEEMKKLKLDNPNYDNRKSMSTIATLWKEKKMAENST